jgi:hypothetical protein
VNDTPRRAAAQIRGIGKSVMTRPGHGALWQVPARGVTATGRGARGMRAGAPYHTFGLAAKAFGGGTG